MNLGKTGHLRTPGQTWGVWSMFELQVQAFPLLVLVLACVSFLFGGRCSAWQWWTAVAAVVAVPFARRGGMRSAFAAAGLFALLLLALKGLLPPVFWDNAKANPDLQFYHLPMIQLLAEGWNPAEDPLAEGITAALGLNPWGMAPSMVAFYGKTMAVFSAVALRFTGDATALTLPGVSLLWLGLVLQVVRMYRGAVRWVVLAALAWVVPVSLSRVFVETSLAIAACGLLLTMATDLKRERCDWIRLSVWTVWLMNLKLTGLMAAFVFWVLFALAVLWRERKNWKAWVGRFALFATGTTLLLGVISWNPLVTSWRGYGHPLYPFVTPAGGGAPTDPAWDLRVVNDDFRQMGRMGIWVREYVSPGLADAYYRWRTGKEDFSPRRIWFGPVHFINGKIRLLLWGLFAALLVHPRGRLWGAGGLVLTMVVPWDKIGFTHYEPWLSSLACLALALWTESAARQWSPRTNRVVVLAVCTLLGLWGGRWMMLRARDVDFKAHEQAIVRERIHHCFWPEARSPEDGVVEGDFVPRYNYLTAMENHCRLLLRQTGREGVVEVLPPDGWCPGDEEMAVLAARPLWLWDERQWFAPEGERDGRRVTELAPAWRDMDTREALPGGRVEGEENTCGEQMEAWVMTPWWFYYVPCGDRTEHIERYYRGRKRREGESVAAWLGRQVAFTVRTWGGTYPAEIWRRVKGE